MESYKFNIGDEVTIILGWSLEGASRIPIKGPKGTISDRRFSTREEYLIKEFGLWAPVELILSKDERAIEEKDLDIRPLPPDLVKKAESRDKEPDLPTVKIKGIEVPVIEHFKDIKEYCENHSLFRRWYNRSQFLKYILGTFESDGEPDFDPSEYGEFGKLHGCLSGANKHYCWCIEIYDASEMTEEELEYAESVTGSYSQGFFLKDKDGDIYFVFTDID